MSLLTGCSSAEQVRRQKVPGETDLRVAAIVIKGAESFDPSTIKEGLATEEDPGWRTSVSWMPIFGAEQSHFNYIKWKHDLRRIRKFYQRRGYFNVKLLKENIIRRPDKGVVYLTVEISEGQPARVDSLAVRGTKYSDHLSPKKLTAGMELEKNSVFTQEGYEKAKALVGKNLRSRGHAYGQVRGKVVVQSGRKKVDIVFFVDPGPVCKYGDVTIEGLEAIGEPYVRETISLSKGERFSGRALQEAQQQLYNLKVFSVARVIPSFKVETEGNKKTPGADSMRSGRDRSASSPTKRQESEKLDQMTGKEPGKVLGITHFMSQIQNRAQRRARLDPVVPIRVRLKESRLINVETGGGVALESNRQDVQSKFNWSHRNFFGGLRTLRHFNTLGYAWTLDREQTSLVPAVLFDDQSGVLNEGVTLSSRMEFTQPHFLEHETSLTISPKIRRQVDIGFRYWNPGIEFALKRQFFDILDVKLGYDFSYYNFDHINRAVASSTPLGQDFRQEFSLETLGQTFSLDFRDSPLNPTSGSLYRLRLQEARQYIFGGEFDFFRGDIEASHYLPFELGTQWVTAIRGRFGALYNLEQVKKKQGNRSVDRVPTIKRLYSGGKGHMRSFGQQYISLYRGKVPVGGSTLLEGSIEQRFRLVENWFEVGDVWGASYVDTASVTRGQFLFDTEASRALDLGTVGPQNLGSTLLSGVGAGLWWETPIGPVRADFAYTLSRIVDDPRFRTCENADQTGQSTGIRNCDYLPASKDPVQQLIQGYNFYVGIGHSF